MRPKRPAMLKPGDPVWAELIADIETVVSGRYAEDFDGVFGSTYAPSVEEPGFEFAVLNRKDQQNVLADMVSWRQYACQGMGHDQQRIVIANVLDGKPQEQWLEGVFDEAVLEKERIASFERFVTIMKYSPGNHEFEEMDGDHRPWDQLSGAAKLQYIALDAARCDVPIKAFAEVVKDTIGDVGEAALRVVLNNQKELHAIAKLFPDDGRTKPTPLVEEVKDMLDYVSALETQEKERRLNTQMKDRGKSADLPSAALEETRDNERKLAWMETICRLDAAYMAAGTDALAKMNGIEIHVLYAEKKAELGAVRTNLAEHGDNEIGELYKQKLERQTADMAAWMRVHCPDFREMGQEAAGKDLTDVQQGNGNASLMPEKWDAIYQLWRVERKPDLVTLLRAAAERPEMADVPLGHFKAAYGVMKEGEWGCFRNSMSEVPTSRGMEQEAFKTSLAELKEMATERTKQPEDRKSRDKGMEK
jgi:hypothetical protein